MYHHTHITQGETQNIGHSKASSYKYKYTYHSTYHNREQFNLIFNHDDKLEDSQRQTFSDKSTAIFQLHGIAVMTTGRTFLYFIYSKTIIC